MFQAKECAIGFSRVLCDRRILCRVSWIRVSTHNVLYGGHLICASICNYLSGLALHYEKYGETERKKQPD